MLKCCARAPPVGAWIDFLKALDAWIAGRYPALQSRSLTLAALDMEKQFVNYYDEASTGTYGTALKASLVVFMPQL